MFEKTTTGNISAFICFICAKAFAFGGVAFGFIPSLYMVGAIFLGIAFFLIICSISICIFEMKRQNKLEDEEKNRKLERKTLIEQMMEDGSLKRQLRSVGLQVSEIK